MTIGHFFIVLCVFGLWTAFSNWQERVERDVRETRKLMEDEERRHEEEDEI
jgi:hypothetical protein